MYNCPLCTKSFKTSAHLNLHLVSHTKEKPHKCPQCTAAFGQQSSLNAHVRSVHDGIQKIPKRNSQCHMCDIHSCGFKTKYKNVLLQHGRAVHSDDRPYECPTDGCNYSGKTKTCLENHLRIHSNKKIFACTVSGCTYNCKLKKYLKSHTSNAHSFEKPFKCSTCDYRAKTRQNVNHHQLTHMKMKRFHCQVPNCGYASHHKSKLKLHVDRKHKKKTVSCTEFSCNFRCASITLLKVHLKRHELPMLKCPGHSCDFSTRFKRNLLKHISRCHTDLQSAMSVEASIADLEINDRASVMRKLHCHFPNCGYQTTFSHHFDRHLLTHKKEEKRDHVCPFCFFRFSDACGLTDHIQRHIGEKPYSCSLCKYTAVRDGSELRSHARKFHHIHVSPRVEGDELRKCRTCSKTCSGYYEFVLHSISHLQPIVVLERLKLHIL